MFQLAALLIASAHGFEVSATPAGDPIRWDTMPILYGMQINDAPPELTTEEWATAMDQAFAAWMDIPGTYILFQGVGVFEGFGGAPTFDNTVWFNPEWEGEADVGAHATLAVDDAGNALGFDIEINATLQWSNTGDGADAQAVLTHEIGHALGLAHSSVEAATMFMAMHDGDNVKRELDLDDEEGAAFLYGHTHFDPPSFFSCSHTGNTPWSATAMLIPLLLIGRRRTHNGETGC